MYKPVELLYLILLFEHIITSPKSNIVDRYWQSCETTSGHPLNSGFPSFGGPNLFQWVFSGQFIVFIVPPQLIQWHWICHYHWICHWKYHCHRSFSAEFFGDKKLAYILLYVDKLKICSFPWWTNNRKSPCVCHFWVKVHFWPFQFSWVTVKIITGCDCMTHQCRNG